MSAASDFLACTASPSTASQLFSAIDETNALLPGHFALQRQRHSAMALRFRAIARDSNALALAAGALIKQTQWSWAEVTIVSPETAGFFLGAAIAKQVGCPHAVVQTDMRRLPTNRLVAGTIPKGAPVVVVNDVASTGTTLDPIRELIQQSGATFLGVLAFAVVGPAEFLAYGNRYSAQVAWSMAARWSAVEPGPSTCDGCQRKLPLLPIAEFS